MKQNRNGYKPSKIAQKMFADLFVYCIAHFDMRKSLPFLIDLWYTISEVIKQCSSNHLF